jgi:hypothetical protein
MDFGPFKFQKIERFKGPWTNGQLVFYGSDIAEVPPSPYRAGPGRLPDIGHIAISTQIRHPNTAAIDHHQQ